MLLRLDFSSQVPIYRQIRDQIVVGIGLGESSPRGEKLPAIRALAEQSGVNMMTVSKAYSLLKQEGFITTDRRGGTVVTRLPGERGARAALARGAAAHRRRGEALRHLRGRFPHTLPRTLP